MGTATVIIKMMGEVIACMDWDIEDIKTEYSGAKTIYNDRGDEITIPAHATEEAVPGDSNEECTKYTFGEVEIYVEFF